MFLRRGSILYHHGRVDGEQQYCSDLPQGWLVVPSFKDNYENILTMTIMIITGIKDVHVEFMFRRKESI